MIPVVIVGFAMITLGVALLFLGEVPFLQGKRIPAIRSRLIGLALMMFLPAAFAVRRFLDFLFGDEVVEGLVVTWILCGVSWFAAAVILFRVVFPKKERRAAKAVPLEKTNPFGAGAQREESAEIEASLPEPEPETAPVTKPAKRPAPVPKPSAKKSPRTRAEDNPFDFS